MTPAHPTTTCPHCNGRGVRCTGCGSFYAYGSHMSCLASSCRDAGAPVVCRCGRVHEPAA